MAPPSTPDKFPPQEAFDTLIKVEVGEGDEKRTFEVFKGVLSFYSGYFDAALHGRWKEATDGTVKLPCQDPQVFELFVNFIHTRRFYESTLSPAQLLSFELLAKMWVFGDAHDVPLLQNAIIDVWKIKASDHKVDEESMRSFPGEDTIDYILENTMPGSSLQELLIDVLGMMIEPPWSRNCRSWGLNSTPDALVTRAWYEEGVTDLREVIRENSLVRPIMAQFSRFPVCHWHVHESGVNCFTDDVEARYEKLGLD